VDKVRGGLPTKEYKIQEYKVIRFEAKARLKGYVAEIDEAD